MKAQTPEQFTKAWYEHINQLTSLCWSLDYEDHAKLRELQEQLKQLTDKASKELDK